MQPLPASQKNQCFLRSFGKCAKRQAEACPVEPIFTVDFHEIRRWPGHEVFVQDEVDPRDRYHPADDQGTNEDSGQNGDHISRNRSPRTLLNSARHDQEPQREVARRSELQFEQQCSGGSHSRAEHPAPSPRRSGLNSQPEKQTRGQASVNGAITVRQRKAENCGVESLQQQHGARAETCQPGRQAHPGKIKKNC